MNVTIIIRAKNEQRYLRLALETIFRQRFSGEFDLLLIDSGSRDSTLKIAAQYPVSVKHISPQDFSFGYALNLGANMAQGDYVVHLSAHCVPCSEEWLQRLVEPLQKHNGVIAAFGRQIPIPGVNPYEEFELNRLFNRQNSNLYEQEVFSNSNCAIVKEVVKAHPFCEEVPFAEDYLWLKQLPQDYRVEYIPEAAVYHSHPLRIPYWFKRFMADGIARSHFHSKYRLPSKETSGDNHNGNWPRRYLEKMQGIGKFLAAEKYWFHLTMLPAHELLRLSALLYGLNRSRFG